MVRPISHKIFLSIRLSYGQTYFPSDIIMRRVQYFDYSCCYDCVSYPHYSCHYVCQGILKLHPSFTNFTKSLRTSQNLYKGESPCCASLFSP